MRLFFSRNKKINFVLPSITFFYFLPPPWGFPMTHFASPGVPLDGPAAPFPSKAAGCRSSSETRQVSLLWTIVSTVQCDGKRCHCEGAWKRALSSRWHHSANQRTVLLHNTTVFDDCIALRSASCPRSRDMDAFHCRGRYRAMTGVFSHPVTPPPSLGEKNILQRTSHRRLD